MLWNAEFAEGIPVRNGGRSGEQLRVSDASECLAARAKAGTIAIGARLPVARDSNHHEFRIDPGQFLPSEIPVFQHSWAEILDDHVGISNQ